MKLTVILFWLSTKQLSMPGINEENENSYRILTMVKLLNMFVLFIAEKIVSNQSSILSKVGHVLCLSFYYNENNNIAERQNQLNPSTSSSHKKHKWIFVF